MKYLLRITFILFITFIFIKPSNAQKPLDNPQWASWQFLIGEWVGEGSGQPGEGSGYFSFLPDLQNTVLMRKSHAEYPASKDRPAFSHDDLMIVYQDTSTKAMYIDNEGHIINYSVEFSKDKNSVTFVSSFSPTSPRYRLIYIKLDNSRVKTTFEIAPPGEPDAFVQYLEGTAQRK